MNQSQLNSEQNSQRTNRSISALSVSAVPDRHLANLIKKLEDLLNEFQKDFQSYNKRAKIDYKEKFSKFQQYLAIYFQSKSEMTEEQKQIFQKYIVYEYLPFPDIIENQSQRNQNTLTFSSPKKESIFNKLSSQTSKSYSTTNTALLLQQKNSARASLDNSNIFSSPTKKIRPLSTNFSSNKKKENVEKQKLEDFENNSSPNKRHQLSQLQENRQKVLNQFFIKKCQALLKILTENEKPDITQEFFENVITIKKIEQLKLLKYSEYSEKLKILNTYVNQQQQITEENNSQIDVDEEKKQLQELIIKDTFEYSAFFSNQIINPNNIEFLKAYKSRTDCIILLHVTENNEITPHKLRVVFSQNIYETIVEFLGVYKEFRIFKIFGGSEIDFQEFQYFLNINLHNLKNGDVIQNSEQDVLCYSVDVVKFITEWFQIQIEHNKSLMKPTYNLVRLEEYQDLQKENERLQQVIQNKEEIIDQRNSEITEHLATIDQLENLATRNKKEIQDLNEEILEKDKKILEKEDIIGQKDNEISQLNDTIQDHKNQIEQINNQLDMVEEQLNETIQEQKQSIEQMNKQIEEKDMESIELREQIENKNDKIQNLEAEKEVLEDEIKKLQKNNDDNSDKSSEKSRSRSGSHSSSGSGSSSGSDSEDKDDKKSKSSKSSKKSSKSSKSSKSRSGSDSGSGSDSDSGEGVIGADD